MERRSTHDVVPLTGGPSRLRDREPRHPAFGEEREFEPTIELVRAFLDRLNSPA